MRKLSWKFQSWPADWKDFSWGFVFSASSVGKPRAPMPGKMEVRGVAEQNSGLQNDQDLSDSTDVYYSCCHRQCAFTEIIIARHEQQLLQGLKLLLGPSTVLLLPQFVTDNSQQPFKESPVSPTSLLASTPRLSIIKICCFLEKRRMKPNLRSNAGTCRLRCGPCSFIHLSPSCVWWELRIAVARG